VILGNRGVIQITVSRESRNRAPWRATLLGDKPLEGAGNHTGSTETPCVVAPKT